MFDSIYTRCLKSSHRERRRVVARVWEERDGESGVKLKSYNLGGCGHSGDDGGDG